MTMRLSLLLTADAQGAKSEIDATAAATGKLKTSIDQLGNEAAQTRTQMAGVQAQARATGQAMTLSAGSVGNLTAQFNDIGMMLMAGQNPLMLAVQQGTQISQVIGPMGAAGAVRALGAAFMGMMSPVSLVTVGSIAAGAAMIQWLTGATDKAVSLEDAVADLSGRVDGFAKASKLANASAKELVETFGQQDRAIRSLLQALADVDRRSVERSLRGTAGQIAGDLGLDIPRYDIGDQANLAKFFDLSIWSRDARREINSVLDALVNLDQAGTLEEQVAAGHRLAEAFRLAAESSGDVSEAEDRMLGLILESVKEAERFQAVVGQAPPIVDQIRAAAVAAGGAVDGIGAAASGIIPQLQAAAEAALALARNATAAAVADATGSGAAPKPNPINGNPGNTTFGNPYAGEGSSAPSSSPRPRSAPSNIDAGLPPVARKGGCGGGGRSPLDEGLREARQLYEETRSSAEKYAEGVERVNKLHQLFPEIVTSDVKGRALDKLKEDYTDLGRLGQEAAGAIRNAFAGIFDDPARALKNLAAELAQMALFRQMAGWFPSMFGAQGAVPLLSRAGGGPIHGPGTSTSDSILMWASNGEYMVNAASAAAYRPILEAINADKTGRLMDSLPRRAAGGIIGQPPGARRGGGMAPGGAPSVSVKVENYTGQPAREERGTGPDGEEMIAIVVGKQMARGKYDRSNRARYGERPDPVRR